MAEPRCGLVHIESMRLLAKTERGSCDAQMSKSSLGESKTARQKRMKNFMHSAFEFKLQVAKAHDSGEPDLLWIRIGAHPQRCLYVSEDGRVKFKQWMDPRAQEPLWRIHYLEAQQPDKISAVDQAALETCESEFPAMCVLQNLKTSQFLTASNGQLALHPEGHIWGFVNLRGAATPGKVLRTGAMVAGVGVAVASGAALGVSGVTAVGAVAKSAAAVHGAAAVASGATTGVASAVSAAVTLPAAVTAIVTQGMAAASAVTAFATVVSYGAVGIGCGVTLFSGGAVASSAAGLMNSAKDPGLYVWGLPLVPDAVNQKLGEICDPDHPEAASLPGQGGQLNPSSHDATEGHQDEAELSDEDSDADDSEAATGATSIALPWQLCKAVVWDKELSNGLEVSEAGRTITLGPEHLDTGLAMGSLEAKGEDRHIFVVTINKSRFNEGGGILIGVADSGSNDDAADVPYGYAFNPGDGSVYSVASSCGNEKKVMHIPCVNPGAAGSTVAVRVDMAGKKVGFASNDGEFVDCSVALPASVRLWARIQWATTQLSVWSDNDSHHESA